ncbi:hypothetical protein PsorP6_012931 [Peronosclerospora sorghi]|uniref:Uncharacterized protein n=1 Tax=Peronosclerospora sorghi TaxID=230839 RepID=A0ACC0WI72_9STRA|nr:hypothetical protein PsorP6_012931 [Peronosclerospora sorghi]
MLPTLNRDGDIVLLDKITPKFWKLQPGEVVIAKSVTNPRQTVCKRIIAQEGDTIPKGHVWLEGDNKYDSHDSRYYGPVPCALILGRVVMRVSEKQERAGVKMLTILIEFRYAQIWPIDQFKWMKKDV